MMFAEWVTNGVAIGVTVFFAVITVLALAAVILGMLGLGIKAMKEADDANERPRRY